MYVYVYVSNEVLFSFFQRIKLDGDLSICFQDIRWHKPPDWNPAAWILTPVMPIHHVHVNSQGHHGAKQDGGCEESVSASDEIRKRKWTVCGANTGKQPRWRSDDHSYCGEVSKHNGGKSLKKHARGNNWRITASQPVQSTVKGPRVVRPFSQLQVLEKKSELKKLLLSWIMLFKVS